MHEHEYPPPPPLQIIGESLQSVYLFTDYYLTENVQ